MSFAQICAFFSFVNASTTTVIYTLSLHDALPICWEPGHDDDGPSRPHRVSRLRLSRASQGHSPHLRRSEEHTSELQSPDHLVCRLLLEKKKFFPTRSSSTVHFPSAPRPVLASSNP